MEPEETRENIGDLGEASVTPQESFSGAVEQAQAALASALNRRKFLAAAALGSAAAAFVQKTGSGLSGVRIGPLPTFAHTLNKPCTAQDFHVGTGIVLNACDCTGPTGTFDAIVAFPVESTQNATRKCIALHVPGRTDDIILRNTEAEAVAGSGNSFFTGSGTGTMYAKITGFPCNATQLVCLGANTVTAWETSNQASLQCTTADQNPPGGQCRRGDICVQPFNVTLDCNAVLAGVQTSCTVECGSSATLVAAAAVEPITAGTPLTYTLYLGAGTGGTQLATSGPTSATTYTFNNVAVTPPSTTYTVQLCDSRPPDCCRTAQVTVNTTALDITSATGTPPLCAGGSTTLTACSTGATDVTFQFSEGATVLGTANRDQTTTCGSISVVLGPGTHTIDVLASNTAGTCTDTAQITVTVPTPVTVTLDVTGEEVCNSGQLTFTATPSGGVAPYTFTFKKDGVTIPSTGNTAIVGPVLANGGLDTACHRITVEVKDNNNCPASPATASITYQQCVTTTLNCTLP